MASGPYSEARRISSSRCSRTGNRRAWEVVSCSGSQRKPLDDARVDGRGVEEHDAAARPARVRAGAARRAGKVDEEGRALGRRRRQRERGRPVLELARDPLDLVGREIARVEAHEQQRLQVLLLERHAGLANAPTPKTSCSRCQPRMRANS